MGFSRAKWHSGLTYKQTCEQCRTTVTYTDHQLDYRPWFADGFVYCPVCKKPLRHNEIYAINNPAAPNEVNITSNPTTNEGDGKELATFCNQCGHRFNEGDIFCCKCGTKR